MNQILLAVVLIPVPVGAFTAVQVYARSESPGATGLGDLSSFETIISDVEARAAKGDLTAAAKRVADYETAWDERETAIRPLNQTYWGNIDQASDAALKALRASTPSVDKVNKTLSALMAVLKNPAQPAQ